MCGCEHHWDKSKPCTCNCPEHERNVTAYITSLRKQAEAYNRRRHRKRVIVAFAGMAVGAAMGSFVTTWIMENLL